MSVRRLLRTLVDGLSLDEITSTEIVWYFAFVEGGDLEPLDIQDSGLYASLSIYRLAARASQYDGLRLLRTLVDGFSLRIPCRRKPFWISQQLALRRRARRLYLDLDMTT